MIFVDSHCHTSPYWYEPVESLLFQMDRNGVERAVLVQFKGQFDNEYQLDCVRRYPGRLVSVVIVDVASPNALGDLERLAERGARGVRLAPGDRSPGDDPLAIWRKAAELGLAVSCGGTSAELASGDFAALVGSLPGLPIVLEHLGSLNQPDGEEPPPEVRRRVFSLARFANAHVKIHGLGEITPRPYPFVQPNPFAGRVPSIVQMACEAFGPERMMWGSDFPPVSGREGYGNALRFTLEHLADRSEADRAAIFGGTALRVFRFDA